MQRFLLVLVLILGGCTQGPNHLGNPLLLPLSGLGNAAQNAAYNQRRGQVELLVKTNHPQILVEIDAGGGPVLWQAMEIARIPLQDRSARVTQLRGDLPLYQNNLEALIVAFMVYGS